MISHSFLHHGLYYIDSLELVETSFVTKWSVFISDACVLVKYVLSKCSRFRGLFIRPTLLTVFSKSISFLIFFLFA